MSEKESAIISSHVHEVSGDADRILSGKDRVWARYDGSTLPTFRGRHEPPPRSRRREDDPAHQEAVWDYVGRNPRATTMNVWGSMYDQFGMGELLVRRIVNHLVDQGLIRKGQRHRHGGGNQLFALEPVVTKPTK